MISLKVFKKARSGFRLIINRFRKKWKKWYGKKRIEYLGGFYTSDGVKKYIGPKKGNYKIKNKLKCEKELMVSRHGRYEIRTLGLKKYKHMWKRESAIKRMKINAGFFPDKKNLLDRFADEYIKSTEKADVFCAWHFKHGFWKLEERVFRENCPDAVLTDIRALEFLWYDDPWTAALRGKKVLVVHPFADTIERQYQKREYLFPGQNILPEFGKLETLKAVQSAAGNEVPFDTWFDALEYMKEEMAAIDFDTALIGAGAYGLPLAAHARDLGKQGIQLGGITQLLFGIMGKRWENRRAADFMNESWTRPDSHEVPPDAEKVEGGAYW